METIVTFYNSVKNSVIGFWTNANPTTKYLAVFALGFILGGLIF